MQTIKTHTKFVQDVRYSSSGERFASVGSDAKAFIYDGKTGETSKELTQSPHTGTIVSSNTRVHDR
jgi:WD40 repeat protein